MPQKKIDTSAFKLDDELKAAVAVCFGRMMPLSEILDDLLKIVKRIDSYPDITGKEAKDYLRESIRTCNPNDQKFNVKKYGAAYETGRQQYIRNMGNNLLAGLDQHIKNLNFALKKTTFNFQEGLNIKDYASITKDLVQAATLYQAIADAHRPNSEVLFDMIPALNSENQPGEQQSLPSPQKSLPSPDDDVSTEGPPPSPSCKSPSRHLVDADNRPNADEDGKN